MAFHERPYYGNASPGEKMGPKKWSMVTWLIVINAVIFVLGGILEGAQRGGFSFYAFGNFNVPEAINQLQLWRFITYQFLHAGLFHILFNMIALYFFGPLIENWLGSRRFLAFYLLCGSSGAYLYTLLHYTTLLPNPGAPMVGASGSVYGVLIGCAVLFPNLRVMLLFPPIPIAIRTLASIFIGLAIFSILVGSRNAGGEAAHLGGAILGYFLIKRPDLLNFADVTGTKPGGFGSGGGGKGKGGPTMKQKFQQNMDQRRKRMKQKQNEQVDQILDKIRRKGIASLSSREKKILEDASKDKMKQ